ncbi:hypothetical protein K502DRAFT_347082 [Neoconidiobolus thromboides FSU 785]|nr:hypothetical protein K502DRAFT_347082 [Neoconidiobolus thromboides FSU 785]
MPSYHKYARFEICKNPHLKRKVSNEDMTSDEDMTVQDFNYDQFEQLEKMRSKKNSTTYEHQMNNSINVTLLNQSASNNTNNTNNTSPIFSRFNEPYYEHVEHHFF